MKPRLLLATLALAAALRPRPVAPLRRAQKALGAGVPRLPPHVRQHTSCTSTSSGSPSPHGRKPSPYGVLLYGSCTAKKVGNPTGYPIAYTYPIWPNTPN